MKPNKRDLKSYVRYDGLGMIVPGSVILARKMPKVGHWKEITAYECCNYTSTTSTTTTATSATTTNTTTERAATTTTTTTTGGV